MENFFKSKVLKKDKDYISAVRPTWYQQRYRDFMRNQVLVMQTLDMPNSRQQNNHREEDTKEPLSARQMVNRVAKQHYGAHEGSAGPQDHYHPFNDDESMLQHSINRESNYS
jgi:hypothetical protein